MSADLERRNGVAVITIDNPPVNALGADVRSAIAAHLAACQADAGVEAIVLAGRGRHFSAGADIRELGTTPRAGVPNLVAVIELLESSPVPVIAALEGTVAGGGLELALACDARIAARDTTLSLPEVTLGLIPGAGGTQRLPRLVGLDAALDMIVSGRRIDASHAARIGLVTDVPFADVVEAAVHLAGRLSGRPRQRTRDLPAPPLDPGIFARHERSIARDARGRLAPRAALDAIREGLALPFADGLRHERQVFLSLVNGPEARALRHAFFAERAAARVPGLPDDTPTFPVRTVGVVGFGTMGSGIAASFANAGLSVRVVEADPAAMARGRAAVGRIYESAQSKGRLTAEEAAARLARIEAVDGYAAFADVDLVVEAAFEDMDVKRAIFAQLDAACRPDAILATNTSSLDVAALARGTTRPERVVGMHFFSPAHVMKLVEIVRPAGVSPATLATVVGLASRLGKIGVVVGVCDGFVGNRMLYAYRRQADFLLEDGATPEQVDRALTEFGLPMGPYQMADLAGLDISWRIRKRQAPTRPSHLRYSPIADRLCERGRFGQKTGAGWYKYEPGNRTPIADPEVTALIEAVSAERGITRRAVRDREIVERCMFALVNEGARLLEEGIATRASDIDVVWIHGYGFPRHRGGPMFWASEVGLARVAGVVRQLHEEQGELVVPSPLLLDLAQRGRGFDESASKQA
jgi:3-hydroxyacyl-CoA dehydrogenase